MTTTSHVLSDMAALRSELRQQGDPHCELFRLHPWRALLDIAFDWLIVLSSVALVVRWSELFAPLAVVLIANRQRALGNLLHDAGHRNLWRDRRRNDLVARLFIAPLLPVPTTSNSYWPRAHLWQQWVAAFWRGCCSS